MVSVLMMQGSKTAWKHFCTGWENGSGVSLGINDRKAIAAAVHLLSWRVITRYMSYDGSPDSGFDWASPADPVFYKQFIGEAEAMLDIKRISE